MARCLNEDTMALTSVEAALLLALARGAMSGYELARQAEDDSAGRISMSNGTVFAALKRMYRGELVTEVAGSGDNPGKPRRVSELTRAGRMVLEWEIAARRRMVRLAEERL